MKLITWNCQGAFRKKADVILQYKPDILIVQECEYPDKLSFDLSVRQPEDVLWIGDNVYKGLGVFSYSDYRFSLVENYNKELKFVLPLRVTGVNTSFTLFAIWANNKNDPDGQYIEQVWKALHYYDKLLDSTPIILAGDFNGNTIWDRKSRVGNHSNVVKILSEKNIHSIYHKHFNQEQGKENHATFFLQRNKIKPYHIDYCFASQDLYEHVESINIGDYDNWIQFSDHCPLIINFGV